MSNLLPQSAQRKAWALVRSRAIFTVSLVMSGAVFVALLALTPSLVIYYTHILTVAPATQLRATTTNQNGAVLTQTQTTLSQLAPLSFAASSTPIINIFLAARPKGVMINRFTYVTGKSSTISVSGTAETSDILNEYRLTLASSGYFSAVSIPINALIGSKDGHFTMTLTIKP